MSSRDQPSSSAEFVAPAADKDLGFYFAGSGDMLRKLEASKPVRRTRTEKNKLGATPAEQATTQEPSYLFKWQREGGNEEEEEDEEDAVADKSSKTARWAIVSGNVPPSQLSIAAFYEKNGLKAKQLRDGLVNCGGVIMIPPMTLLESKGNGGAIFIPVLHDRIGGDGDGLDTDELFRRDDDTAKPHHAPESNKEVLMLRRKAVVWPPEPPGFPPPPPDPNDVVVPKKVPAHTTMATVRRLSRVQGKAGPLGVPVTRASPPAKLGAVNETMAATGALTRQAHSDSVSTSASDSGQRRPSTQQGDMKPKQAGGGFMRRISFLPAALGKTAASNLYPGAYASNVLVPYVLPPPPEPPKMPAPGSNDERKNAKMHLKKMFLEDLYSQLLEFTEEKRRTNEACREMEVQITEADVLISQLMSSE